VPDRRQQFHTSKRNGSSFGRASAIEMSGFQNAAQIRSECAEFDDAITRNPARAHLAIGFEHDPFHGVRIDDTGLLRKPGRGTVTVPSAAWSKGCRESPARAFGSFRRGS